MQSSANHTVLLENIDTNTSGKYKCEVSADAPSFQTEKVHTELVVKDFYDPNSSRLPISCPTLVTGILLLLAFL